MSTSTSPQIPARYRARSLLRECQHLVQRLLEVNASLALQSTSTLTSRQPLVLMEKLISKQRDLRSVVDEIASNRRLHASLEVLRAAVAAEDARIAALAAVLRGAESRLQDVCDEAQPRLEAMEIAGKRPVDAAEVLSYGSKISATLHAPAGWDGSQGLGRALPPAPPEDMMRAGKLAKMDDGEGAGKAEVGAG